MKQVEKQIIIKNIDKLNTTKNNYLKRCSFLTKLQQHEQTKRSENLNQHYNLDNLKTIENNPKRLEQPENTWTISKTNRSNLEECKAT